VQVRVEQIIEERDRVDGLIEAMLAVTAGLDLDTTLQTIVHTAIDLIDARYSSISVASDVRRLAAATRGPRPHVPRAHSSVAVRGADREGRRTSVRTDDGHHHTEPGERGDLPRRDEGPKAPFNRPCPDVPHPQSGKTRHQCSVLVVR
jgi:hypothetical protein